MININSNIQEVILNRGSYSNDFILELNYLETSLIVDFVADVEVVVSENYDSYFCQSEYLKSIEVHYIDIDREATLYSEEGSCKLILPPATIKEMKSKIENILTNSELIYES
ncbi:Uncharacterised protein [Weeksella virosa]|uniref:Uncharacterized protein n=1 Tax=Weeksella virosa (strain ATCC 43766 / DSM 16922 / JCM 21250 / CCUG 30538 / CDC 9751 / IAM 14551 / NBRC 16016 / NCTC 11634 / CL345/78) TaxID=865938 RepID=F0NY10_WEEVC|nr:hypothetical protein [Weeksella virosa]ADX67001.1 hypothetical protein Weevi_0279 [Weeksella virosa DSM 16922]VEH63269.1 Uncharacterised protein [Weeksella virosa]